MMLLADTRALVLSVGDLVRPPHCDFDLLTRLDSVLGRAPEQREHVLDSAWKKVLHLGNRHEKDVLDRYRREFGATAVRCFDRPKERTSSALEAAWTSTLEALQSDATVLYQPLLFDGSMLGYADFLVRTDEQRWLVVDAKLSAANSYEAKMQVAAYSSILGAAGVQLGISASIAIGGGAVYDVDLDQFVPAFASARARVSELVTAYREAKAPVSWLSADIARCGRCSTCLAAVRAHRDLLLVLGVQQEDRELLVEAGVTSVDELADVDPNAVPGLPLPRARMLQRQAALQLQPGPLPNVPASEVFRPHLLGRLPVPDTGDLFLSFAPQGSGDEEAAELDHHFSVTSGDDRPVSYWGDDRAGEADAFRLFLEGLALLRTQHPGMHVYFYSPVERPHLGDLADRTGLGRSAVERLHADGVLVDLFSIVKDSIRVGVPDLSLREVGRLADPDLAARLSSADVAADRAEHARLLALGDVQPAAQLRSRLERENGDRAVVTRRLRDHLLEVAASNGVEPATVTPPRRTVSRIASSTGDDFTAAALDYHGLEESVFWRAHERRRHRHTSEWSRRVRGALSIDAVQPQQEWERGPKGGWTRLLRLRVTATPGTVLRVDDRVFACYDGPALQPDPSSSAAARTVTEVEVLEVAEDEVLVRERLAKEASPWSAYPSALGPGRPPRTSSIRAAVDRWANSLLRGVEPSAADDLVGRTASRTTGGGLARIDDLAGRLDVRASLIETIESLDRSFVAVQGPPGSGKTRVGARVVAELVARGYRIGVVAQSHAVVEHFLDQIVVQGGSAERVGKAPKGAGDHRFTSISRNAWRSFAREHADGFVLGGTAWDFTNAKRVPRDGFDLLVVDEAGQFGLVNAIAVAQSARNLLLLGDPQQLPQVSQASHRAMADSSALGWLMGEEPVLDQRYGYFLDRTWRMHPALTRAVSDLSYGNRLTALASARARRLDGIAPGLHVRPVAHIGHTDSAAEEAVEVVRICQEALGRTWVPDEGSAPRSLTQRDVMVVAPYNAQVECIGEALAAAGLPEVEVGTVDRFQGREAAVAIYSATVSNLSLRPQATDFVLSRNRLNVAISRAQWAAFIVHAPRLTAFSPRNEVDAAAVSRFLRLLEFAPGSGDDAGGSRTVLH